MRRTTSPSWLYAIEKGATTIWENWEAILPDGTRTKSSYNHFAYGCVGAFLYRRIGGLYRISPGFDRVKIEPDFECGLKNVSLSLDTIHGLIQVEWKIADNGQKCLMVQLPPNVRGEVHFNENIVEIGSGMRVYQWR